MKKKYFGITYPKFLQFKIIQWIWARVFCKKNCHLFDEVLSLHNHCLHCDGCGLHVEIKYIETEQESCLRVISEEAALDRKRRRS
jgi:hypothetical protein